MKLSIITSTHLRNVVTLLCLTLLINIGCENKDIPAAEESSPSKQVGEKIPTIKGDATKPSQVVVEVNGIKLTQSEVDEKISKTLESIKGQFPQDQMAQFKQNLQDKFIEDFITRTLINQEADKQNIVGSDSEIKLEIEKIKMRLPEGTTLEAALTPSGMTMEDLRENITFSLRFNKLLDSQIKTDLTPSEEETRKYYTDNKKKFDTPETVHARHILIKVDDKDDEKTKSEKMTKIEALRKQLVEGADFEKLAKENSECPSGKKGGDLGTFPRGRMVKPFEEAAFSQKVNDIGPVVQTKFGYHIIQTLERNQATQKTFDEVKDKIKETLMNKKRQDFVKNYIAELKKKAKIVYGTTEGSQN